MEGKTNMNMPGVQSNSRPENSNTTLHQSKAKQLGHDQASSPTAVRLEAVKRFIKGGASGLLSGALMQPMQVVKTSMQVSVQDQEKFL